MFLIIINPTSTSHSSLWLVNEEFEIGARGFCHKSQNVKLLLEMSSLRYAAQLLIALFAFSFRPNCLSFLAYIACILFIGCSFRKTLFRASFLGVQAFLAMFFLSSFTQIFFNAAISEFFFKWLVGYASFALLLRWKSIMLAILCPLCCFGSSFKEIFFCTAFSGNFSRDFLVVFPMCELCSACWPASVPLLPMKLGWRSLAFDQSLLPFFPKNHSIKPWPFILSQLISRVGGKWAEQASRHQKPDTRHSS